MKRCSRRQKENHVAVNVCDSELAETVLAYREKPKSKNKSTISSSLLQRGCKIKTKLLTLHKVGVLINLEAHAPSREVDEMKMKQLRRHLKSLFQQTEESSYMWSFERLLQTDCVCDDLEIHQLTVKKTIERPSWSAALPKSVRNYTQYCDFF